MKRLLAIVLLFTAVCAKAQYDRVFTPLFEERPGYPNTGWIVGLGATYNLNNTNEDNLLLKQSSDSLFYGDIKSSSFVGIYGEVGRFHYYRNAVIINNIDYGLAFKQLKHFQELDAYLLSPQDPSADTLRFFDQDAKYNDLNITAHFNFNRIFQMSNYSFIMPGFGVHGDFRFGGKKSFELEQDVANYQFPEKNFKVAVHAKLAFGFKLTRETFLVPSVEIQLYDFSNLDSIGIGRKYFHSNYNPIIFAVKYYIHRPLRRNSCAEFDNRVNLDRKRRRKKGVRMF